MRQRQRTKRRFLRQPLFWQVGVPFLLVVATLALGICGFMEYHQLNTGEAMDLDEAFYLAAGLPILETTNVPQPGDRVPWSLQVARGLGLLVPPYAVFVVIGVAFRDRLRRGRVSLWRMTRRPYVVLCGLGWQGHELARDLFEQKRRTVIIEKDGKNPFIHAAQNRLAVTFNGDAGSSDILKSAQVGGAEKVYVLTGNEELNCRVVNQLAATMPPTAKNTTAIANQDSRLKCYVHVEDQRMREFLENSMRNKGVDVFGFNTWETTARSLLSRWPVCRFGDSVAQPGTGIHVAIIGDTPMAKTILQQILRTGNYLPDQPRAVTIIARDVKRYEAEVRKQYPCLSADAFPDMPNYAHLQDEVFPKLRFVERPDSDAELLDDRFSLFDYMNADWLNSIFVCLDDGMLASAYVTALHPKLKALRQERNARCQALYYFNYPDEQPPPLHPGSPDGDGEDTAAVPVVSFGNFLERSSVAAVEGTELDRLAVEVKGHYLKQFGDDRVKSALENMKNADRDTFFWSEWNQASEWDRESNRQAADHIAVKLHCIGARLVSQPGEVPRFDDSDIQDRLEDEDTLKQLAIMEHRRWCAERLLGGWRPLAHTPQNRKRWDAEKNSLKQQKQHIDLVPFSELGPEEQIKDYSQIKAIPTILKRATERGD